jgi:hypothetical protein
MSNVVDEVLTRLEEVSARAFQATGAASHEGLEPSVVIPLIEERGATIAELNNVLETVGPLSYSEWNRLAIVHFQGNRIQANLLSLRSQLVLAAADTARAQAFIERLAGAVGEQRQEDLSEPG